MYNNLIIYYFSGTGNARLSAEQAIKVAKDKGLNAFLISIDRFKSVNVPDIKGKTLIGFCDPTHGFNIPWFMLKFILKFPKIKDADIFLLNTRAGMKMYKIFTPGLTGIAQVLPLIILKLKGYSIRGLLPVDMPSNWISIHPGLRKKVVDSIAVRCNRIVSDFSEKVISGKRVYKGLLWLPVDLIISPISLGYILIGRFGLAKTFFASYECDKCMICIENCPVQAVKLKYNHPYWKFKCESCMRCMNTCPKKAINTSHTFTALLWYFIMGVFMYYINYRLFVADVFDIKLSDNAMYWVKHLSSFILFYVSLVLVYIAYEIMHFGIRYNMVNKLLTFTSLTKFRFWRRYKAPKNY